MIQTIIVAIILAICVLYVARAIWRSSKGKGGCGCGCDDCPVEAKRHCNLPHKKKD